MTLSCVFAVGKTSLITRFMYDSFDNIYQVNPYSAHTFCLLILDSVTNYVPFLFVKFCKVLGMKIKLNLNFL